MLSMEKGRGLFGASCCSRGGGGGGEEAEEEAGERKGWKRR